MLEKPKRLVNELLKWQKAGRPVRPIEVVSEIFNTKCKLCEYFDGGNAGGRCNICGCAVRRDGILGNKIAMATTRCPLEEPKWVEYEGATDFHTPEEKKIKSSGRSCCN